ncbi:MAG: hypothetical protein HY843_07715 [Bdellovibrio sp.]|nr:hypothetical protein [Bdellovibrio sp.]
MARVKDQLPSSGQGWIHELARSEINPEADKILGLGQSFEPTQLVEESTVDFMMELRECFMDFARILNSYSENGTRFQEVKVYSVAQTPCDFMVFRNQMKLVFSNSAHGVIQMSFAQHNRSTVAIDGQLQNAANTPSGNSTLPVAQELLTQVGPFRDVYWTFQGDKVSAEQVAKFYFAEFICISRDTKKSKLNQQVLLEQIKNLLEEKGLSL